MSAKKNISIYIYIILITRLGDKDSHEKIIAENGHALKSAALPRFNCELESYKTRES